MEIVGLILEVASSVIVLGLVIAVARLQRRVRELERRI